MTEEQSGHLSQLAGMNYLPYLRAWRAYRAMGLVKLAEEAGVSRATMYNLEMQKGKATITTISKLAKALRVKPTMLVFVNPEDLPEEGRGAA